MENKYLEKISELREDLTGTPPAKKQSHTKNVAKAVGAGALGGVAGGALGLGGVLAHANIKGSVKVKNFANALVNATTAGTLVGSGLGAGLSLGKSYGVTKKADFDFDAHNSIVSSVRPVNAVSHSTSQHGWKGNMESFMQPSKLKRAPGTGKLIAKAPVGLLKKTLNTLGTIGKFK